MVVYGIYYDGCDYGGLIDEFFSTLELAEEWIKVNGGIWYSAVEIIVQNSVTKIENKAENLGENYIKDFSEQRRILIEGLGTSFGYTNL